MIVTDDQLDKAMTELGAIISNIDYNKTIAINDLVILSQGIAELKMRRTMRFKKINENTSTPGEGS